MGTTERNRIFLLEKEGKKIEEKHEGEGSEKYVNRDELGE